MKELYLIPKHTYEYMNKNTGVVKKENTKEEEEMKLVSKVKNKSVKKWKTNIPPKINKRVPLKTLKYTIKKNQRQEKPNLSEVLKLHFLNDSKQISQAQYILKYFMNNSDIIWDHNGDLFSPYNNYNIIDIIKHILSKKRITGTQLNVYKYLITTSGIPIWAVTNENLQKILGTVNISGERFSGNTSLGIPKSFKASGSTTLNLTPIRKTDVNLVKKAFRWSPYNKSKKKKSKKKH